MKVRKVYHSFIHSIFVSLDHDLCIISFGSVFLTYIVFLPIRSARPILAKFREVLISLIFML